MICCSFGKQPWYVPFYLWFVFALAERKNEPQNQMQYRLSAA